MMKKSLFLTRLLLIGAVLSLIFLPIIIEYLQGEKATSSEQETDIKQLVMEFSTGKRKDVSASITSRELILMKGNKKEIYPLPEDEFFVSIAPYIEGTHPCAVHNLITCRGELPLKEFNVYIEDSEGKVIFDQRVESYPNGFIDLWLPRNKTYQVTIEFNGKTATSEISTFDNSNTCITTVQLS